MKTRINLTLIILNWILICSTLQKRQSQDLNEPFQDIIHRIDVNNQNGIHFLQIDTQNQPYENKNKEKEKLENQTIFDLIVQHNKHIRNHNLENIDILKKSITTIKVDGKESKQINVVMSIQKEKSVEFWCNELNLKKKQDRIVVKQQQHEQFDKVTQALKKCGFKNFLGEKEMTSKHHKDKPIHHHNVKKNKEIKHNKDGQTKNVKSNEDAYYKDENTEKSLKKKSNKTKTEKKTKNGHSSSSSSTTSVSYSNKTSTGDVGEFPQDFDFQIVFI